MDAIRTKNQLGEPGDVTYMLNEVTSYMLQYRTTAGGCRSRANSTVAFAPKATWNHRIRMTWSWAEPPNKVSLSPEWVVLRKHNGEAHMPFVEVIMFLSTMLATR